MKALHEAGGDDYRLPDLNSPLFISAKVLELDGKIVLFMGARLQCEMYLLADKSPWMDPRAKMACIQALDVAVREEAYNKGIDDAVCYIPPTKKRFIKRVINYLRYFPPRRGWTPLSRPTKETQ